MRIFRFISLTLLLLIVIAGGALAYLLTQDLGQFKGPIEKFVTKETGRTFAIRGEFDLDLGRQTRLLAEDVHFGNPDWAAHDDMVRVGRAQIIIDLWSVFDAERVVINLIEIEDIAVALEVSETGAASWTFGEEKPAEPKTQKGFQVLPFVVQLARIGNLQLSYDSPDRSEPLRVHIDQYEQRPNADNLFDASFTGTINDRTVSLAGTYGPLIALRTGINPRYNFSGQFDTLRITSDGDVDDLFAPQQPRINLRIEGPDINHVTDMLGLPSLGEGLLDLTATVKPTDPGVNADIEGNLGPFRVSGAGRVEDLGNLENLSLGLDVEGPNLGRALGLFGIPDVPEDPFDFSAKVTRSGKSLHIDEVILNFGGAHVDLQGTANNFPNVYGTKLNLNVTGSDFSRFRSLLKLPVGASGPYEITGVLEVSPEGKQIVDLKTKTNISDLSIQGTVTEPPGFVGTRLKLTGRGADLSQFGDAYGIPGLMAEPFGIDGEIEVAEKGLDTPVPLQMHVGENHLSIDGRIGWRPLTPETRVDIGLRGPALSKIAARLGLTEGVPAEPFDVKGRVSVLDAGYRLENVKAKLGDARLTLDGTITNAADFAGSHAKVSADVPDLRQLITANEDLSLPEGPVAAAGTVRLESEALHFEKMTLTAAGAKAGLDLDVSLPFDFPSDERDGWGSAWGRFDFDVRGPNLQALLPDTKAYRADKSTFSVKAKGGWKNAHWTIEGATAELADAVLNFKGKLDEPPKFPETDLTFDTRIASLARLGVINGNRLPDVPLELEAHFSGSPTVFAMDHLQGLVGKSDLKGRLAAHLDSEIPEIEVDIDSKFLDLTPFLSPGEDVESEVEGGGDAAPDDGRVIPDTPLPLDRLRTFNAQVTVDVEKIQGRISKFNDFALHATVENGRLNVTRFGGEGSSGKIVATMSIEPIDESAHVKMDFHGSDLFLNLNEKLTEEDARLAPRFDADITMEGRGLTVRQVAAALNGRAKVSSDGGRSLNAGFSVLFGDFFNELITAINPFVTKEPYTQVSCIVVLMDIHDGIVALDPGLVWQTDKINAVSKGEINLKSERVNIDFRSAARKGIGISAGEFINPYLKIAGTMRRPQLTLDPTSTIVVGGAAVATAGLSILAKAAWDRAFRKKDPCGAALAEAEKKWKD
jgi:hypothetical protein